MSDNAVAEQCRCSTRYYTEHDKTEFVRVDSERSHYVDCPLAAPVLTKPAATELDLAPIEARAEKAIDEDSQVPEWLNCMADIPALIAEVKRLRKLIESQSVMK